LQYPQPIEELVESFRNLPGVGPKTALRMTFYVLNMPKETVERFSQALINVHKKIHRCPRCFNLTDTDLCYICKDPRRDKGRICVVQDPRDLLAIEKTGEYRGSYHVLHGSLSPMEGVTPEDLTIKPLLQRLQEEGTREVILATNPNVEGEATALYLARLIHPLGIRVTRIAYGLPMGGDLEYADQLTLSRALEGRREVTIE